MSLAKEWLLPVTKTLAKGNAVGPVYALGDQVTLFTLNYARKKLQAAGLLRNPKADFVPCHQNPKLVSFQTVLGLLGLNEFHDIDFNGKAALNLDYSKPIPAELKNRAGVVIDIGTSEHIFNLTQVFANIVELLQKNGLVLHLAPLSWYNHGFVNFNPIWFKEFYQANAFEIVEHGLIVSPFGYPLLSLFGHLGLEEKYLESRFAPFSFVLNDESRTFAGIANHLGMIGRIIFLFAARKLVDDRTVKFPLQDIYAQNALQTRG